ncbi:acetyltransferase [Marinomonas sp. M1K-6]|uniref:Acetyltransferase n=1 Tax=Marinomonas profundi TaxID=2726122 RepID=A0A847QY63_9GAMM|nr:acetyltransferase [Marinomonas profundi]NLQ18988.1 acetyltransferase [Marinomonas profundi]
MKGNVYGIFGASGFGREVMPLVKKKSKDADYLVFIDDAPKASILNGYDVLTFDQFLSLHSMNKFVTIAIADAAIREKIANRLKEKQIEVFQVEASNVEIMDEVKVGEGAILSPFVTLTSNIHIGKYFQANIYSYVAHDCIIGDFVTFAPSVKCNGNVHVEDFAYIGTGAIIKQGTPDKPIVIGKGAVVGMGAIVTKSVKAGDVVFGNPAKSIKRGT